MNWLKNAVDRGVKRGVHEALEGGAFKETIDGIIRDMMAKPEYAFFVFIKHIQAELMRVDPKMSAKDGLAMAKRVYNEHLAEAKVAFGHPDYSWDKDGAVELARAYEIDHWESAP